MKIIRATYQDIPRIMECARQFCSVIPDCKLDESHYAGCWGEYIRSGSGVIFLMEHDGEVCGGIGGMHYPDLLTAQKLAVELFWYVKPEYRTGMWPIRLLKEFEVWASMCYCTSVNMIHMECSMPEKLAEIYQRLGYSKFETIYRKKL